MSQIRKTGESMLGSVLTEPKNCKTFEKYIFRSVTKDYSEDDEDFVENYYRCLYQIVGDLIQFKDDMKTVLKSVKKGKIGWKHECFVDVQKRIEEHDDYLISPFEVVEGVIKCPKCGCMKTWSVQRQTRSSDEPMTTFSRCVECNHKWKYSG